MSKPSDKDPDHGLRVLIGETSALSREKVYEILRTDIVELEIHIEVSSLNDCMGSLMSLEFYAVIAFDIEDRRSCSSI